MVLVFLSFFTQYKGFCLTLLQVNQFRILEIDLEPYFSVGTGAEKACTYYKIDLIVLEYTFRGKLFKKY